MLDTQTQTQQCENTTLVFHRQMAKFMAFIEDSFVLHPIFSSLNTDIFCQSFTTGVEFYSIDYILRAFYTLLVWHCVAIVVDLQFVQRSIVLNSVICMLFASKNETGSN